MSSLLLAAFAIYGTTLAVVLFVKKSALKKANLFLGILLISFCVFLLQRAILETNTISIPIWLQFVMGGLWYSIPPLIFLHALYVLYPSRKFKKWDLLHTLPVVLHVVNTIPFFIFLGETEQGEWIAQGKSREDILYVLMTNGYVLLLQFLIYMPWSFIIIKEFLKTNQSRLDKENTNRIKLLRKGYIVLSTFIFLMESFRMFHIQGYWTQLFFLGIIIVIFYLAFLAIYNPDVLFKRISFSKSFRSKTLPIK
ncbi:MAG: hypothetical protein AAF705_13640, partial [Bacteroidota bacterium]